mgnify:CR=1 FL=1
MTNILYRIKAKTEIDVTMSIKKISFPYYQIKKGETLKSISQKFEINSTKILLDNNISPRQIKEGKFIILKKN